MPPSINLPAAPRIVLILPCCIGDVVLATATLQALRRAFPDAHITWAVGAWSRPAIEHHPALNAVLDTGASALPVRNPAEMWRFVRQLRVGRFDLAVSLVRSPLMSVALLLSGIPQRAGLDSNGRGFGYTVRAKIDPDAPRHEAEIYLDVVRVMRLQTDDCHANIPVSPADNATIHALRQRENLAQYIVLNPAGGQNPGMTLDIKRYPAPMLADLGARLAARLDAQIVVLGSAADQPLIDAVIAHLPKPALALGGKLSFGEIAALAQNAALYIGNDTGITHLAAATGAPTAMILGPTDPARYAPFTQNSLAIWKPAAVSMRGVSGGAAIDWDWQRDGVSVDDAEAQIVKFMQKDAG